MNPMFKFSINPSIPENVEILHKKIICKQIDRSVGIVSVGLERGIQEKERRKKSGE